MSATLGPAAAASPSSSTSSSTSSTSSTSSSTAAGGGLVGSDGQHEATPPTSLPMSRLKKPSEAFLGGMFWDWNAQHYPYITGGYCSPRVGKNTQSIKIMAEPYGHYCHKMATKQTTQLSGKGGAELPPSSSSSLGTPSSSGSKRIFFAGEATSVTAGSTGRSLLQYCAVF